jgi:hypothetical protein
VGTTKGEERFCMYVRIFWTVGFAIADKARSSWLQKKHFDTLLLLGLNNTL